MRKCLKSWTEGKSILSMEGGVGDGKGGYKKMNSGMLECDFLWCFLLFFVSSFSPWRMAVVGSLGVRVS